MFSFRTIVRSAAAIALSLAAGSQARAALTEVRSTPHASEQGFAQILGNQYGGSFAATANGFTNGAVTATRVDDGVDRLWTGGLVTFTPVASFSRSEQSLGLSLATGSGYEHLFSVNSFGYVGASPVTVDLGKNVWDLTLDNSASGLRTRSAGPSAADDQMVTYKINGAGGKGNTFLLFWEDTPLATSDKDYNDLVVQAKFAGAGGPAAVPLPPAVAVGGLTLLGAAGFSAWKRRKARLA
ncbi:MAG TPA: hypothetical protein VF796_24260 [Humisphaera sp.]